MAIKQRYRFNPEVKEYQIIEDFSAGENTKISDSLLTDNIARNVTNFNIISGGLLSKRKGFVPIGLNTGDGLNNDLNRRLIQLLDITGTDDEKINAIKGIEVIKSWSFNVNNEKLFFILISYNSNNKNGMINLKLNSDNNIEFINLLALNDDNVIIENYGEKLFLINKAEAEEGKDALISNFYEWDFLRKRWIKSEYNPNLKRVENINKNWEYHVKDFFPTENLKSDFYIPDSLSIYNGPYPKYPERNPYYSSKEYVDRFDDTLFNQTKNNKLPEGSDPNRPDDVSSLYSPYGDYSSFVNQTQTSIISSNENSYYTKFPDDNVQVPQWTYKLLGLYDKADYDREFTSGGKRIDAYGKKIQLNFPRKEYFDDAIDDYKFNDNLYIEFTINCYKIYDVSKLLSKSERYLSNKYESINVVIGDSNWDNTNLSEKNINKEIVFRKILEGKARLNIVPILMKPGVFAAPQSAVIFITLEIFYNNEWIKVVSKKETTITKADESSGPINSSEYFMNLYLSNSTVTGVYRQKKPITVGIAYQITHKVQNKTPKYVPDSYSFQNLSYNLLNLRSDDLIEDFDSTKFEANKDKYALIDTESEIPTLGSVSLINGYFPQVNIEGIYKASLELPSNVKRTSYKFGWLVLPLEEWAKLEASIGTGNVDATTDYIEKIIKPAFKTSNPNSNKSYFNFTPKTSNQYILIAFATNKDPNATSGDNAITSLADVLQIQKNIIPISTQGEKLSPYLTLYNFYRCNKSITWKNQMFVYGNSNNIFVSDVNNFGYFPMLNNLQIPSDAPIESMAIYYDSLIIATKRRQYVLTGNTPQDFILKELNSDIGVTAHNTVKNNMNYLFQLTDEGVFRVKTLFNFQDRFNIDKMDEPITGDINISKDSAAVVFNNKYFINSNLSPDNGNLYIYYNDFKSWIKYQSPLFVDIENMHVLNNELYIIKKTGGLQILIEDKTLPGVHGDGSYADKDAYGNVYDVVSIYKSKQIDFGLPNHDKKFKKLQVRFEDTPGLNEIYTTVWCDSTITVDPEKVQIEIVKTPDNTKVVQKVTSLNPNIKTVSQSNYDLKDTTYASQINNIGNKFDNDVDQLHEVVVAGRGRQIQFEILHKQNKTLNIKNFGTILKLKKPKSIRITSRRV